VIVALVVSLLLGGAASTAVAQAPQAPPTCEEQRAFWQSYGESMRATRDQLGLELVQTRRALARPQSEPAWLHEPAVAQGGLSLA
jgi:hypothetical protein